MGISCRDGGIFSRGFNQFEFTDVDNVVIVLGKPV